MVLSSTGESDSLKVLIVSHNPITTYNNMGKTFMALFSAFSPDELCQLYLYPSLPDSDICRDYYRFTDMDALRSVLDRRRVGKTVTADLEQHSLYASDKEEQVYSAPRNKTDIMRLGRDIIWKLSNWSNPALNEWIDRQAPDIIFAAGGMQEMLYDMAMSIARQRGLPLISYICDDYYYSAPSDGIIPKIRAKRLRGKIEEMMKASSMVVTISQELTDSYSETFSVRAETVMTCPLLNIRPYASSTGDAKKKRLIYMGNLSLGRDASLLELGEALHEVNNFSATGYSLDIYTGEKRPEILSKLSACPSIRLHGFVTGDEYKKAFDSADVFVHVESFEAENRERVRYSVSTKIIECLASGRPLLAYGPADVASIAYLRRNDCAALAQSRSELFTIIKDVLGDEQRLCELVGKAENTAKREAENSRRLHGLMEELAGSHDSSCLRKDGAAK